MIQLSDVQQLDQGDPLAQYRAQFNIPAGTIYLDGNSLGVLPKTTPQRLHQVIHQQWGEDLISSWNTHQWIDMPLTVGAKIAKVIGANAEQVVCCDSISVNLFKALAAAIRIQQRADSGRTQIISTADNFPTDLYMVQGLQELLGQHQCELVLVSEAELEHSINSATAAVLVTEVNFRSGRRLNLQQLTQHAHDQGALVIADLAHSAGAVPLAITAWEIDFAVGCTYKYLNGGPGAPAFIYVAAPHLKAVQQPLQGWMGHARPFAFEANYEAAEGIQAYLSGTPSILALAAVDSALDIFADVDMKQVHAKAIALADLFDDLLEQFQLHTHFARLTPHAPEVRGSQLSYSHPDAYAICQALIARGVIADFRAPSYLRLGFTPLYLSFEDIWNAVEQLAEVLQQEEHLDPKWLAQRGKVT